ncbi:hypothetical protein F4553_000743 [Allocatelliglobosispora scoriae]|uniref:ESX secretion-associated protein EspG n=1 Tax=Allocatelliglobosispora scoriae TaxID=643052 RepID=A0A841BGF8_9ACTN|nr:hypothetical protein [Allocatelliglobosispora scoriae]MBB5867364.1 hypothetical protein [Allocatelliglobosispora scoriae]
MTGPDITATADELDALAYGLTGEPFPGTEPTLLDAVAAEHRPMVAARIVRSLALRGIVEEGPDGPAVAPGHRDLLACRLAPETEVTVRVGTPTSSRLAVACRRDGEIVVHTTDGHGIHRLRSLGRTELTEAVLALMALPADVCTRPPSAQPSRRARYQDLLHGGDTSPLAETIAAYRYAAKLVCVHDGSVTTTAVLAAADGPIWIATMDPDADGDDGWVLAHPIAGADLRGVAAALVAGSPSHTARPDGRRTLAS